MTKRNRTQNRIMVAFASLYSATGWREAEPLQWLAARGILKDADDALNEHIMGKGPRLDYAAAARHLERYERQHTLAKNSGYTMGPPDLSEVVNAAFAVMDSAGGDLLARVADLGAALDFAFPDRLEDENEA